MSAWRLQGVPPLLLALLLTGCGDPGEEAPPGGEATIPTDAEALLPWLLDGGHRGWEGEPAVRATSAHGGARVFLNPALAASVRQGRSTHPVGAAAVRELYAPDMVTLRGFGAQIKTHDGEGGASWLWYEVFEPTPDATPVVAEHGARGCVGCHGGGRDFVQTDTIAVFSSLGGR